MAREKREKGVAKSTPNASEREREIFCLIGLSVFSAFAEKFGRRPDSPKYAFPAEFIFYQTNTLE